MSRQASPRLSSPVGRDQLDDHGEDSLDLPEARRSTSIPARVGGSVAFPMTAGEQGSPSPQVLSAHNVGGVQLEAFKPNIMTIDRVQKNTFLKFILTSFRRNQAPEKFYLIPRSVEGIHVKVIPSAVVLSGYGDHVIIKVVITSINPKVRCGQPYSVLLTATNKFTRLTDLYGLLIENQREDTEEALPY